MHKLSEPRNSQSSLWRTEPKVPLSLKISDGLRQKYPTTVAVWTAGISGEFNRSFICMDSMDICLILYLLLSTPTNQIVFKDSYLPKASSTASCPIKLTVGPIPELEQLLVNKNKSHLSVNHRTFKTWCRFCRTKWPGLNELTWHFFSVVEFMSHQPLGIL